MYPNNYSGFQPYTGAGTQSPYFNTQYQAMPQAGGPNQGQVPVPFPQNAPIPKGQGQGQQMPGMLPIEESYIENILRLNKGKLVEVYATFENNSQWNAKIFKGIIEAAGRDHLILSDPQTGQRILLPMVYLDYVTFEEEIEYEYPFGGGAPNLSSYPPR
ncbi:spore coat protein GerQ [Bacillus sp. CGMCC 1.16607]|uniref:spore coat protein GerQ n=1 Tax=Bacillus sp. CGMCC 1.16607 TaxID=3351842 RepID=UPI00364017C4